MRAVVTGGTRGIGLAVAERLAAEPYFARVAVLARSANNEQQVHGEEKSKPIGFPCDVSSADQVREKIGEAARALGGINVLVNCAGITAQDALLVRSSDDMIHDVVSTNLLGAMYTCRATIPHFMRAGRRGEPCSIVNIGSIVGSSGNTGQSAYAASKAGLTGLTKSLAKELGSRGVRVNLVEPGYIDTSMTEGLATERKSAIAEATPLQRLGNPEEVAHLAAFLCGPESGFITGQVIRVDGGLNI
eukprot:g2688.t1